MSEPMPDAEWYAARAFLLRRTGRALTKAEHDMLTRNLGRALTDDPINLRPGRDVIAPANERAKSRARINAKEKAT